MNKIKDKLSDTELLIMGEGPERDNLVSFCKKAGLDKHVRFLGNIQPDRIPYYYADADIAVFSTLGDTCGLAIPESMAAGLPVVCSKFSVLTRDLIRDGENGFIVDPRNEELMASKILLLLKDEQVRHRMGKVSLEIMKSNSSEAAAKGFLAAIRKATA